MRLDESCEPAFARHETFHPRYGWVKKGYDAAFKHGPDFFNKNLDGRCKHGRRQEHGSIDQALVARLQSA